ncbi:Hypothetical protein SMAX5B_022714 [Scophthalmus maximus]|uniref:Secreted protein n=1 Tax=Scophthalmus maximus TaxID=52904 RepID=A0A2U9AW56_SCOMX|nr:Hypothetical protein SMAX5B_022714 [Scophthalmus maximus]
MANQGEMKFPTCVLVMSVLIRASASQSGECRDSRPCARVVGQRCIIICFHKLDRTSTSSYADADLTHTHPAVDGDIQPNRGSVSGSA